MCIVTIICFCRCTVDRRTGLVFVRFFFLPILKVFVPVRDYRLDYYRLLYGNELLIIGDQL